MKISANYSNPDYHEVVNFIDTITVDGIPVKHCISIDTDKNEAVCFIQPMRLVDGNIPTHVIEGKIDIIWLSVTEKGRRGLFLNLKGDWEEREATLNLSKPQNKII